MLNLFNGAIDAIKATFNKFALTNKNEHNAHQPLAHPVAHHPLALAHGPLATHAENEAPPFPFPVGFSFAPAGLLMPYHLGVLEYLKFAGILTPETPLAGSSAGALAVACVTVDNPIEDTMNALFKLEDSVRKTGARAKLKEPLVAALEQLLPENAHEIFNRRPAGAYVTFSSLTSKKNMVRYFTSREDLLECVLASCNIPFYLSRSGYVTCRGMKAMDGFFADVSHFGCPSIPGVERQVRVMPFPARQVATKLNPRDTISPDLILMDEHISEKHRKWFEEVYLAEFPAYRRRSAPAPPPPDQMKADAFDIWLRLRYALNAAPCDDTIVQFFDAGRRDAFRWLMCNQGTLRPPYHQGDCLKLYPLLAHKACCPAGRLSQPCPHRHPTDDHD